MRKLRAWGLAALALGMAVHTAIAGEDEPAKKPEPSFWGRLFGRPQKPTQPSEDDSAKEKAKPSDEDAKAREARQKEATRRAQEEFLRRQKVIDTLSQLAIDSGDKTLYEKVEFLSERAWTVYLRKSGQTGGSSLAGRKGSPETGKAAAGESRRGEEP